MVWAGEGIREEEVVDLGLGQSVCSVSAGSGRKMALSRETIYGASGRVIGSSGPSPKI